MFLVVWAILCSLCYTNGSKSFAQYGCFKRSTNTTWKLVWQDEFDGIKLNTLKWKVDHHPSSGLCPIKYDADLNCNLRDNVWMKDGQLIMEVKKRKYGGRSYTGAVLTSKKDFSYGRFEIRLALPVGKAIDATVKAYSSHIDFSIVGLVDEDGINWRAIRFSKNENFNINDNSLFTKRNESTFHLYGFEWSKGNARFFFDNTYGKELHYKAVNKRARKIKDLHWNCPALLIDYIRFYEKVDKNNFAEKENMCTDGLSIYAKNPTYSNEQICNLKKPNNNTNLHIYLPVYSYPLIIIIILLIIGYNIFVKLATEHKLQDVNIELHH